MSLRGGMAPTALSNDLLLESDRPLHPLDKLRLPTSIGHSSFGILVPTTSTDGLHLSAPRWPQD